MHAQSPVGIIVMDRIFADVKMELYAPDFSSKADADGDADCVTGKPLSALGYSPAVQISKNGVTGFVQTTGSGAFALLMAKKVLQEKNRAILYCRARSRRRNCVGNCKTHPFRKR